MLLIEKNSNAAVVVSKQGLPPTLPPPAIPRLSAGRYLSVKYVRPCHVLITERAAGAR